MEMCIYEYCGIIFGILVSCMHMSSVRLSLVVVLNNSKTGAKVVAIPYGAHNFVLVFRWCVCVCGGGVCVVSCVLESGDGGLLDEEAFEGILGWFSLGLYAWQVCSCVFIQHEGVCEEEGED